MEYWEHQNRYHAASIRSVLDGCKSFVNTAPCGSGKTAMQIRIMQGAVSKGSRVSIYSCRTTNTGQLIEACRSAGIRYGVVAAEYPGESDPDAPVQICQLQTVASRLGDYRHDFPAADYVLVDEAHQQTGQQAVSVFAAHRRMGMRALIGYTATPVNCEGLYEKIVNCVTYKELIECKAHLPAEYYGPDRPDLTGVRYTASGELSTATNERLNDVPFVFGRVIENMLRLNPERHPSILFAASVKHSRGHAYKFMQQGITAAHIDGERVLMTRRSGSGSLFMQEYESSVDSRAEVIEGSRDGKFIVVCNRFVLREAVDMPWLYSCIVACSMGGVSTYLQSVGRVLRYWPHYDKVIIQDHGGNIDRHGLCDEEDRDWTIGCTNKTLASETKRKRENTQGAEAEPMCCPKCSGMRTHGAQCPYCGHIHSRSVRLIRQVDGTLVRKVGRATKYRAPKNFDDYYRSAIYSMYYSGGTVKQAYKIAKDKAIAAGVKEIRPIKIWSPPVGDKRWKLSTRQVYPGFRPRGK